MSQSRREQLHQWQHSRQFQSKTTTPVNVLGPKSQAYMNYEKSQANRFSMASTRYSQANAYQQKYPSIAPSFSQRNLKDDENKEPMISNSHSPFR